MGLARADLHEKQITMIPKETWEQEYSVFHRGAQDAGPSP